MEYRHERSQSHDVPKSSDPSVGWRAGRGNVRNLSCTITKYQVDWPTMDVACLAIDNAMQKCLVLIEKETLYSHDNACHGKTHGVDDGDTLVEF